LLPHSCLSSHPSLCSPLHRCAHEAQQLPPEVTQPIGHVELETRPAAISPPCCWAVVCTLGPHLPQLTHLFPLLSLRPLSGTWTQALRYSCLLLPSPSPEADHSPPHLEPAGSFECEAGVGTPKGPLPCPFTSPGEAGTPPTPSLGHSSHSTSGRRKRLGPGVSLSPGSQRPQGLVWGRSGEVVGPLL